MTQTLRDVVFALRTMAGRPGFTALIVLTLALGIGATTAMFGTVNAALISSLPYEEPSRLVMGRATFSGNVNPWVSGYDYFDYRDRNESLESLGAFLPGGRVTIQGGEAPERASAAFATWDLFTTLGVKPTAGRLFTEDEGVEGGPPVVLISYGYWQRRFGGEASAVSSTLLVNGSPFTVVGVLPPGFRFMQEADVWRLTYRDGPGADARRWHNLLLVGRLKPGVTLDEAQAEIDVISKNLQEQYPDTNENKALLLTPLHDALVENARTSLILLMAAVSVVLLLACGNVAGLLLARGQSRLGEIAIRSAMGASRRRLVLQLLTESLVVALFAGVLGVALAVATQGLLLKLLPLGALGITRPSLDASMLLFAVSLSFLTGLLFGTVPALQGTRLNLSEQLKSGARGGTAPGQGFLRSALVVVQVAASVVLLIGAGLLLRSLSRQTSVPLGFEPSNVLTAGVTLPRNAYPSPEQRTAFFDSLVEEVRGLPGVLSVGAINRLPIVHRGGNIYLHRTDQPQASSQSDMSRSADYRYVLPGYLETIGIPLLSGRDIATTDVRSTPRVMLISESLAELFFPGESPLGQHLTVDMGEPVLHEIVGVVGNARLSDPREPPFHAMYMSYYQVTGDTMRLTVKTAGAPARLTEPLRELLRQKDRNIALAEPMTMSDILDDAVAEHRVIASSLSLFSAVALLLAMVGLYGALAYYVSQKRREIGLRMALGATPANVARSVLSRGLGLVFVGVAIGVAASIWATRLLQQFLFGVAPNDGATFLAAISLLSLVAVAACLWPAWRATRVDPVATLQSP